MPALSLVVLLGPYRNLTTLTASTLALHPEVVSFNHGYLRLCESGLDFWNRVDDTEDVLARFTDWALQNFTKGERGPLGGNITLSHAFDSEHGELSRHRQRALETSADEVRVLVLKESGRITRDLRDGGFDNLRGIEALLERWGNRLKFVRPIRHPFKCVQSNLRSSHPHHTDFVRRGGTRTAVDAAKFLEWCVRDLAWFLALEDRFPKHFFHFGEHRMAVDELLAFLGLSADTGDLELMARVFRASPSERSRVVEGELSLGDWMSRHPAGEPPSAHELAAVQAMREVIDGGALCP